MYNLFFYILIFYFFCSCSINQCDTYNKNPKIWAHRVNSLTKLDAVSECFYGVELDIVINKNCLDIFHPPEPSQNLCFNDYLSHANKNKYKLNYWLDVKNLTEQNINLLIDKLNELSSKYKIAKNDMWVESPSWQLLPQFKKYGYNTSYYLPGITDFLENDRRRVINNIKNRVDSLSIKTISTSIKNYPYIKNNFPNQSKLLWATGKNIPNNITILLNQALNDSTVNIVLITP